MIKDPVKGYRGTSLCDKTARERATVMIRYRLDDLGWYQFEWLVQSLLKAEAGTAVESWGGHGDQGRDAYTASRLKFPRPKYFLGRALCL
jgi:hypothetical protein